MENKIMIAKNDRLKNGVKLLDLCNPDEVHYPSWLVSVKKGNFIQSYGVYAENEEDAVIAFCRFEVSQRLSGKGGLVSTIGEIDVATLSDRLFENGFAVAGGTTFCVNGIKAERARLLTVSANYESMLSHRGIDDRLSNIRNKIAKIILLELGSEKLKKTYEVYEALGGDLLGTHQIELNLAQRKNKFDAELLIKDLLVELNSRGIEKSAFNLENSHDRIVIDTNRSDFKRILKTIDMIRQIDPTQVVTDQKLTHHEHRYIKDLGKYNQHLVDFVRSPQFTSDSVMAR